MTIKVQNTLSGKKERLEVKGELGIYVCGVTPYDYTHVGHARVYVFWDVVRRYLQAQGYRVKYIQNFTDIDDKIIKKAQATGRTPHAVAAEYIADYFQVMDALGVRRADAYPRVTEHIPAVLDLVNKLLAKGLAYQVGPDANGNYDVFYGVTRYHGYGKLSHRSLGEMQAGARVEVDERKEHPMDFALWKAAKPGEPAWPSPWGQGRPGWHVECSAMALAYLGPGFTIHGGGSDLIFPHHENEIAQAEPLLAGPFACYWLHNGFVNVKDEKMSKSLGNTFTVRDVIATHGARVLRFFLLSTHYRKQITYGEAELAMAKRGLERLTNTMTRLQEFLAQAKLGSTDASALELEQALTQLREAFTAAMDDDFNTAEAIASLHDFCRVVNRVREALDPNAVPLGIWTTLVASEKQLRDYGGAVLGLWDPEVGVGEQATGEAPASPLASARGAQLVELLLAQREAARARKDWATADQIRDQLLGLGIRIEDTPQGPRWEVAE